MRMRLRALFVLLPLSVSTAALAQPANQPTEREILASLYQTYAVISFCGFDVDPEVARTLALAGYNLEQTLGIDLEQSKVNFEETKWAVLTAPPDCWGPDFMSLRTILGVVPSEED